MSRYASQIVKELEGIRTGTSDYEVFDDFLDVTLASLKAMPINLNLILQNKPLSVENDTAETQALFAKIDQKYGKKGYAQMAKQFRTSFCKSSRNSNFHKENTGFLRPVFFVLV